MTQQHVWVRILCDEAEFSNFNELQSAQPDAGCETVILWRGDGDSGFSLAGNTCPRARLPSS